VYQSAIPIAEALAKGPTYGPFRGLTNRRIVLRSRPVRALRAENLALEEHAVPAASADQVLLRTLYLSLDPYLHASIEDAANDAVPVRVGQVMAGSTVSRVEASRHGDSLAGQIAKLRGCRTVVLAGAADKRRFATEDTAFDACIERRAPDLGARLRVACPNGIDVYFENAGGAVFNTVLPLLNKGARVPLRGTIGGRDGADSSEKAVRLRYLARSLAAKRIKMQAFIVSDHRRRYGEFVQQMSHWLDSGRVKFREDIVDGLENAPRAFIGVLEGRRFGKLVIRVANLGSTATAVTRATMTGGI